MLTPLTSDRQALAEAYLPLARSRAWLWVARWPWMRYDLYGTAALALVKAAASFDFDLGFSFATYARHRIDGELADFFRDERPCGYRQSRDKPPSRLVTLINDPIDPRSDRGRRAIDAADELAAVLHCLPSRHARVCRLVFFDGLTQAEVARKLGRSQPLVSALCFELAAILDRHFGPHEVAP